MNMRWYWGKIALGAVAIFGVGIAGISVVRRARHEVVRAVETNADLTIPLPFLPFNFEDARIGTFRKVVLHRSSPQRVDGVEATVRLAGDVPEALAGCNLTVDDPSRLNEHSSFRCVTVDSTMEGFGSVIVHTKGADGHWVEAARVPLVLPRDVARRIQGTAASVHASQLEADRFRQLGDSLRVLGRRLAAAKTEAERSDLQDAMQELEDEITSLREAIVETATDRAVAASDRAAAAAARAAARAARATATPEPPKAAEPPVPPR